MDNDSNASISASSMSEAETGGSTQKKREPLLDVDMRANTVNVAAFTSIN